MNYIEKSVITGKFLSECVHKYSTEITLIMLQGKVACVLFEPDDAQREAARGMGWDGESAYFALDDVVRMQMANVIRSTDPVASKWLGHSKYGRIFAMIRNGVLLINYDPNVGFFLEPMSDLPVVDN